MADALPSPMFGIVAVTPKNKTPYWFIRLGRKDGGMSACTAFSWRKHGGRDESLILAQEWRDQKFKELYTDKGIHPYGYKVDRRQLKPRKDGLNTSGIVGISYRERGDRPPTWTVCWCKHDGPDGKAKMHGTSYACTRNGVQGAFFLALHKRQQEDLARYGNSPIDLTKELHYWLSVKKIYSL